MNLGRPKTFDNNAVLEQAMRLFWRHGYDATSLNDLLNVMKIPRQSLYRTFGDKRTLFLRSLELYGKHMSQTVMHSLTADRPGIENINETFQIWSNGLSSSERNGCLLQNTCSQSVFNDTDVAAIVLEYQRRITEAFEAALKRGQLEGDVRPSIDPKAIANTVASSINGLLGLSRIGLPQEVSNDVIQTLKSLIQTDTN
jgi:TetR/AcrR family transcriptional repressor of nem operon